MKLKLGLISLIILTILVACRSNSSSSNEITKNENKSSLPVTGQQTSYYSNDDGALKIGKTRSFKKSEDNKYVVDNVTKLMWQDTKETKDKENRKTWQDAINYCESLTLGGFNDWRLPNIKEITYLSYIGEDYENNFKEFQYMGDSGFWSSTSTAYLKDGENYAYQSGMYSFINNFVLPMDYKLNVRCTRNQSNTKNIALTRDADKEVVIDKNTNLIWQDNEVVQNKKIGWKQAVKYCTDLNFAGYTNWRLPNYFELFSIGDRSRYNPSIVDTFVYVATSNAYWSSTSSDDMASYQIGFKTGSTTWSSNNKYDGYVRCVREDVDESNVSS
jgi:hypothetical protein